MQETLLTLKDASVEYGGIRALEHVTIRIDEDEIVALMGPNGAGKSTALKALVGLVPLLHGEVLWRDKPIHPVAYEMAARGVAYVPQGRQVFKNLTVRENLELGGYALPNRGDIGRGIESVLGLFPALEAKLSDKAGVLSGGQQQMLTIGRALVGDPRVLLLDEPSLGLSPKIVSEMFEAVWRIKADRKIGIVIVEHSIKSVLEIAQRAYVLAQGKVVLEKPAAEIGKNGLLEKVFLH